MVRGAVLRFLQVMAWRGKERVWWCREGKMRFGWKLCEIWRYVEVVHGDVDGAGGARDSHWSAAT